MRLGKTFNPPISKTLAAIAVASYPIAPAQIPAFGFLAPASSKILAFI
jgi:hypothetical protein